jgi:hypothetical protein
MPISNRMNQSFVSTVLNVVQSFTVHDHHQDSLEQNSFRRVYIRATPEDQRK